MVLRFLFFLVFLAAELVVWNPVGDQYVVAYDTTLSVCDVQVSVYLLRLVGTW